VPCQSVDQQIQSVVESSDGKILCHDVVQCQSVDQQIQYVVKSSAGEILFGDIAQRCPIPSNDVY